MKRAFRRLVQRVRQAHVSSQAAILTLRQQISATSLESPFRRCPRCSADDAVSHASSPLAGRNTGLESLGQANRQCRRHLRFSAQSLVRLATTPEHCQALLFNRALSHGERMKGRIIVSRAQGRQRRLHTVSAVQQSAVIRLGCVNEL